MNILLPVLILVVPSSPLNRPLLIFYLWFVLWFAGSGRNDCNAGVPGNLVIAFIWLGLVAVVPGGCGFEIVWNQQLKHAAKRMKSLNMSGEPIVNFLGFTRCNKRVIACSNYGIEYLGKCHFSSFWIYHGNGISGKVDEELFASQMFVPHEHAYVFGPSLVQATIVLV
ncbi:MAG: hypothetical protein SFV17_00235 [Candidatus Obscuribacter sp.]|nr:hypothetical protein [Candidatus Obscuribacter sp.]